MRPLLAACLLAAIAPLAYADGVGGSTFVVTMSSVGVLTAAPAASLDVNGSAQFGQGVSKSTFDVNGDLLLSNNSYILGNSSITASAFFGDGSHLTGVSLTPATTQFAYTLGTEITNRAGDDLYTCFSTASFITSATTMTFTGAVNGYHNTNSCEIGGVPLIDGNFPVDSQGNVINRMLGDAQIYAAGYTNPVPVNWIQVLTPNVRHNVCLAIYCQNCGGGSNTCVIFGNSQSNPPVTTHFEVDVR